MNWITSTSRPSVSIKRLRTLPSRRCAADPWQGPGPLLGQGGPDGTVVYQGAAPMLELERDGQTLCLIPHAPPEAIDWTSTTSEFPALRRVAVEPRNKTVSLSM